MPSRTLIARVEKSVPDFRASRDRLTFLETLGWEKHKLESRLPGEISITSDTQASLVVQRVKRLPTMREIQV